MSTVSNSVSVPPSPAKKKLRTTPSFFDWAQKTLVHATGVPATAFNFSLTTPKRAPRVLLLGIIGAKGGESVSAQGVDLRTREGVTTLLLGVYQLTPLTLVKVTPKHWVFELPDEFPYERLRPGVFSLTENIGFVLLRPDPVAQRTVEGIIPHFWETDDTELREYIENDMLVESVVELVKEKVRV